MGITSHLSVLLLCSILCQVTKKKVRKIHWAVTYCKVTTIYIITMTHNDPLCVTYNNSSVELSYMSAVLSYHCSYLCMYDQYAI
jgi:hypothetical protein